LPARGPYPALKGETRLSLRLMEDVEVPFRTTSVPMPPWANPSSFHAQEYPLYRHDPSLPGAATAFSHTVAMKPASYTVSSTAVVPAIEAQAEAPTTIIALRSGAAIVARQYWIQDGALKCISASGEQTIPLDQVDLGQSVSLNRERNVEFVLQSRDGMEQ